MKLDLPIKNKILALVRLTKPEIMLLVLVTGAASLIIEKSLLGSPIRFFLVLLGLALIGGSANAFNMYFERDIDARMTRTRKRRPLPLKIISPNSAAVFAAFIGLTGAAIFLFAFNLLSCLLAVATIVYYAFFYTLILKPNTHYNIVIGGAAGAMAPIIAWAAAADSLALPPVLLFLVIFLWSPPHFWSLAVLMRKDYETVGLPMLPVVRGENETLRQILVYSFMLTVSTSLLVLVGAGPFYLVTAVGLGGMLIHKARNLRRGFTNDRAREYFGFSIAYLFMLFFSIIVDSFLNSLFLD